MTGCLILMHQALQTSEGEPSRGTPVTRSEAHAPAGRTRRPRWLQCTKAVGGLGSCVGGRLSPHQVGVKQGSDVVAWLDGLRVDAGCSTGGASAGSGPESGRVRIQKVLWECVLPTCRPQGLRGHGTRPQSTSAEIPQGCLGAPLSRALRLPPDCICLLLPRPGHRRAVCALERGAGTQDSALSCLFSRIPAMGARRSSRGRCPSSLASTRDTGATMSGQGSCGWTAAELTGGKWR